MKRILIIDDEPEYSENLGFALTELLCVEVKQVIAIDSAIFELKNRTYDLIITDWYLKGEGENKTPKKMIKDIRNGNFNVEGSSYKVSKIPIIIFSGISYEFVMEVLGSIEDIFFFRKGIDEMELFEYLRKRFKHS
ncbi:MAG: response regulator [Pyrinomonadaceae bacterium]|nr:response regulator [Pyrinomonadaceae bacterium]